MGKPVVSRALDLEPTTLSNYRYQIEVNILPEFGHRSLESLTPEEIARVGDKADNGERLCVPHRA